MIDYRAPVADILFALTHGAEAGRLEGWDDELAAQVLGEAARFIDAEIAPLDPVGDAEHARIEGGRVRLPSGFVDAYAKYRDQGWPGLAVEERWGGQGLPHVLSSAVSEMLSGACITYQMVLSLGQGAMRTIERHGSEAQKQRYLPRLASGDWLATMCLTEPTAGSDLGLLRTMARPDGDGSWLVSGTKIFISGGDHDYTDNIVHLVLARTPDAPDGVKGLSLFVCPAVLEDGTRNAVSVVRLEDKMGMHASPTCQMAFDGAKAELLGAPGEGLARMFTMMNATRIDVAMEGIGLAEVAAQRSRHHAAERRQGRAPGGQGGADPIWRHGDVQRMLLTQMALAQGGRAMVYRTETALEMNPGDPLVGFMTPICKAFCTEAAWQAADLAVQVHGGYGYCREYRVEQTLRDSRITRIYEGTNGIQAMTLAGRELRVADGAGAKAFSADIAAAADGAPEDTAATLRGALSHWQRAAEAVALMKDPGLAATPFLQLSGLLAFGAAWARMEAAAAHAPVPARTRALCAFVRDHMLPDAARLATVTIAPAPAAEEAVFAP